MSPILRFIRKLQAAEALRDASDNELMTRFVARQDEEAFTTLVQRHGQVVLTVCHRFLGNSQDAQDAFQATFLVLVRKARTIRKQSSVGSWLYGVAARVALKARAQRNRREARERQLPEFLPAAPSDDRGDRDQVLAILTEEIQGLPEIYRSPVVLCHLEGKTHQEAARELNCPRGTVTTRLLRARERLRGRLARRGVGVTAVVLSTGLAEEVRAGALPIALVQATVQNAMISAAAGAIVATTRAAALAKGAMMSMYATTAKIVTAISVTLTAVCLSAAVAAYGGRAPEVGPATFSEPPRGAPDKDAGSNKHKEASPEERTSGFLGVMLEAESQNGLVVVHDVFPDSPAAKAGFKAEDVIHKIGDEQVGTPEAAVKALKALKPGDKVKIQYKRGGKEMETTVSLGKWPANVKLGGKGKPKDSPKPEGDRGYLGLKLRADGSDKGVIVREVVADSPAAKAGIKDDDVILKVNKIEAKDAHDFIKQLGDLKTGDKVTLHIQRGDKELDVTITANKRPPDFGPM